MYNNNNKNNNNFFVSNIYKIKNIKNQINNFK